VRLDHRAATVSVPTDDEPSDVMIDPQTWLLADISGRR
jgi:hypothetical protein